MAQKKNLNKQSGQLARQSQNKTQKVIQNPVNQSAPVARAIAQVTREPKVTNGKRMTKIIHRELVTTISGNTTFAANQFYLNPGLSATFPWLSTVANSYEQYRFNRLKFEYVSRAPTSYVGSILMAPDYDALDSSPSSEVQASMMDGAIEDAPWKDMCLGLNVQDMFPSGPRKFVRSSAVTGSDLKTYDAGQLFCCTVACADTSAIGKLWVDYEVDLFIPQNPSTASSGTGNVGGLAAYQLTAGDQALTSGVVSTVIFDNANYNSIGVSRSSGVYTLVTGNYLVSGVLTFAGGTSADVYIAVSGKQAGGPMSPVTDIASSQVTGASHASAVPFSFYFGVTGATSTLEIIVSVTSAAGTLVLQDQKSYLNILKVL